MAKKKVAELLVDVLEKTGIERIYGVPGGYEKAAKISLTAYHEDLSLREAALKRQMRRWKERYEEFGYDGLFDRRLGKPSPKRVPLAVVEEILRLYQEQYADFNVRHFHADTGVPRDERRDSGTAYTSKLARVFLSERCGLSS